MYSLTNCTDRKSSVLRVWFLLSLKRDVIEILFVVILKNHEQNMYVTYVGFLQVGTIMKVLKTVDLCQNYSLTKLYLYEQYVSVLFDRQNDWAATTW